MPTPLAFWRPRRPLPGPPHRPCPEQEGEEATAAPLEPGSARPQQPVIALGGFQCRLARPRLAATHVRSIAANDGSDPHAAPRSYPTPCLRIPSLDEDCPKARPPD